MITPTRLPRLALAVIVLVYLAIAAQYALRTPSWQAPDEPAHFNYVRYVAEHGTLPVLEPGDYPHEYLQQIKDRGFPPGMSIDPIRYESWQPPLYYLLAAGVYRAALGLPLAQQLHALRLLSVALGGLLLLVVYRAVDALAPGRGWLSLGAAAFVASIPMHVATTAAVNNDTLAELWLALLFWQALLVLRDAGRGPRRWLLLGLTLGFAGLTKLSTVVGLPLVAGALLYVIWRHRPSAARVRLALFHTLAVLLPAVLLMLPWLARNAQVYGLRDPLIASRHQAVVVGQERTATWLAQVGPRAGLVEFLTTTFHSFWGQFGWMGVPIDLRLYRGLAILTALAALGLVLRLYRLARHWRERPGEEVAGFLLLLALGLLTGATYVGYNLTFKQHQGRYLFPALIPIAVACVAGWREITARGRRLFAASLPIAAGVFLAGRSALRHQPWDKFTLAGLLGLSGTLGLGAWVPELWSRWLYVLPYPLLLALDLLCLYAFVLPALA